MGLLYEAEAKEISIGELLATLELPLDEYAHTLVTGAAAQLEEIDAQLERFAEGWSVARMPALDRAILRLASFELGHSSDIPVAVILNEAVELAKTYSTKSSGGFINGVLSKVAAATRSE
ncbi:MAG: transcription antitermination factor NusB [Acidimicrobiia bacterium]|nr:transcription antitermination factor NusB [Acidimicrobiia bacterium]MYC58378.1 transcription antitermination factor NusB [Acidimicrobiia bacterium]MYG94137.1 transcription antitermination factor NusB [Acidimicrobiia bacterium]MYI30516.1 transcription antitermination factor NusB [Acidimicrobiia bacterium]